MSQKLYKLIATLVWRTHLFLLDKESLRLVGLDGAGQTFVQEMTGTFQHYAVLSHQHTHVFTLQLYHQKQVIV